MNDSSGAPQGPREFATTHWSLVRAVQQDPDDTQGTQARQALEDLCRTYWYPLYAFVRSRGHSPHDAQDLTQAFFARLLARGGFGTADPERGRFRSWILGALKHFLANEWDRARTQKRGGGVTFLEWDALDAEGRYALEPAHAADPDTLFDREWALALIGRALDLLRVECELAGKGELFQALKGSLTGEEPPRGETGARLGRSEGAVKVAVHRLRQRYRELLRAEIAGTVAEWSEVEAEMGHLVSVLRGQ